MASIYLGLRDQALRTTRAAAGAAAGTPPADPYGVVMDLARADGQATVVAMAGGQASIYFSGGGGSIGGEGNPQINKAARLAVLSARSVVSQTQPTRDFSLPGPGYVQFYVLTQAGVRTARFEEAALHDSTQAFHELYFAMHDVITEYRLQGEPSGP